ncbi:MAG: TolB protein, partial [Actinomycetota bacterium]|nr:TolB protein [Actinomycetota bacterium]
LPVFSPDGTRIAFQGTRGGNFDIFAVNADGTGEKRLSRSGRGDFAPAGSPDGRYLAFQNARRGGSKIYVLDVTKGGGATAITSGEAGQDYVPDWQAAPPAATPPPAPEPAP